METDESSRRNIIFPSAFFLDTNIFISLKFNFNSTVLSSFIPLAQKHSLKLILPQSTEDEILNHIDQQSRVALEALEKARKEAPFLEKWEHFPKHLPKYGPHNLKVKVIAEDEWKEFLSKFEFIRLEYSNINLKEVMEWYMFQSPPFGKGAKQKEFPDAFSLALLVKYAEQNDCVIAVISNDRDFKLTCDRYPSLHYFESLQQFTELLLSDENEIQEIRKSILEDTSTLETGIIDKILDIYFFHADNNIEIIESEPTGYIDFTDLRIVAIGNNECTLTFEAEIELEHYLSRNEWDYELEELVTLKGHTPEISIITGTAKILIEPDSHKIQKINILTIDDDSIEIDGEPKDWS